MAEKEERIIPLRLKPKMDEQIAELRKELGCTTDSETIRSSIRIAHTITIKEAKK